MGIKKKKGDREPRVWKQHELFNPIEFQPYFDHKPDKVPDSYVEFLDWKSFMNGGGSPWARPTNTTGGGGRASEESREGSEEGARGGKGGGKLEELKLLCRTDKAGLSAENAALGYQRLKQHVEKEKAWPGDDQKAHRAVLKLLDGHAIANVPSFRPRHITPLMSAHAVVGSPPDDALLAAVEDQAAATLSKFSARELANFLLAYAKLGVQPRAGLVAGVCAGAEAVVRSGDFKPQFLVSLMWAVATLKVGPADRALVAQLCARTGGVVRQFNHLHIANFLWACGELGLAPSPPIFAALCDLAGSKDILRLFRPRHILTFLAACASLGTPPPPALFSALCYRVEAMKGGFGPAQAEEFKSACRALGLRPEEELSGEGRQHFGLRREGE